jgi:hypothetical protein
MSESNPNPFWRKEQIQQPGIVGAQWWNEGLSALSDPVSRRKAIQALALIGGTVAVGGLVVAATTDSDPEVMELYDALTLQRERGWNFGAAEDPLTFADPVNMPIKSEDLDALASELAPRQAALKPFYQATLFQSVLPTGQPQAVSLRGALRPISTPAMKEAWLRGLALESLFSRQEEVARATAVLVDLPGPESVAFAVALASRFEPVFTYDNWPHPIGVVPAHLTLAAVVFYQSLFRQHAQKRPTPAPPVFVLDRNRLAPYTQEQSEFDNRYVARMPTAEQLRQLGVQRVLYVVPGGSAPPQELDDLNEDFLAWRAAGLDVKLVAATDFRPEPAAAPVTSASTPDAGVGSVATSDATAGSFSSDASGGMASIPRRTYYYGGSPDTHDSFWTLYPWAPRSTAAYVVPGVAAAGILSAAALARLPSNLSGGHSYEPSRRTTLFSSLPKSAPGSPRPLPSRFGKVGMWVGSKSRSVLGPAFSSRSSWSRSSSYSSGS